MIFLLRNRSPTARGDLFLLLPFQRVLVATRFERLISTGPPESRKDVDVTLHRSGDAARTLIIGSDALGDLKRIHRGGELNEWKGISVQHNQALFDLLVAITTQSKT